MILDAETGAIADVNPFLIKMLGYAREEFVEKKLWQVGAFKDIEASREAFEALQKNEFIRYEDLPLRAKNGRLVDVEFVSNVYLWEGKRSSSATSGMRPSTDILFIEFFDILEDT